MSYEVEKDTILSFLTDLMVMEEQLAPIVECMPPWRLPQQLQR